MSSEAQVILDVWDAVRDHIPHAKRASVAHDVLTAFVGYGFERGDCDTIVDEDPDLSAAFGDVFEVDEDDEDEE